MGHKPIFSASFVTKDGPLKLVTSPFMSHHCIGTLQETLQSTIKLMILKKTSLWNLGCPNSYVHIKIYKWENIPRSKWIIPKGIVCKHAWSVSSHLDWHVTSWITIQTPDTIWYSSLTVMNFFLPHQCEYRCKSCATLNAMKRRFF